MKKCIGDHEFKFVGTIEPERDDSGIRRFLPQPQYGNDEGLSLHSSGIGPFCQFRVENANASAGVYIITVDGIIQYVGKTSDLRKAINNQLGHISPSDCYVGGQLTNCRINGLIMYSANKEQKIELWFLETENMHSTKVETIDSCAPAWNTSKYKHRLD